MSARNREKRVMKSRNGEERGGLKCQKRDAGGLNYGVNGRVEGWKEGETKGCRK